MYFIHQKIHVEMYLERNTLLQFAASYSYII